MILDKASIDAVVSKETDELSDEIYRLFTHFYHVLKNEGLYISLSIKNFGILKIKKITGIILCFKD